MKCVDASDELKRMEELFGSDDLVEEMVPAEAFQVASQFRAQHGNDLKPELIEQLLTNLNLIWREREKK